MNRTITDVVFVYVAHERCGARRRWWRPAARIGLAAALLVVLALRVGSAAFARGIESLSVPVVVAAFALTALSTWCAAWRWRVVARDLGAPLSVSEAVAAYYHSQLLNSVLPGGVVGDAHRAVAHGRDVDDLGRAARAVVWERTAGQIVQAIVTIAVLAIMPSPARWLIPVLAVIVGCLAIAAWRLRGVRALIKPRWPVLAVASIGVMVSHVALLVLVARAVDPAASVAALVPLAVIVLTVAGIPLSVAGWGLREGAAAWAFAAAGIGASAGVAASTAYGVVSLLALAPGVAVFGMDLVRRRRPSRPAEVRTASQPRREVVVHG